VKSPSLIYITKICLIYRRQTLRDILRISFVSWAWNGRWVIWTGEWEFATELSLWASWQIGCWLRVEVAADVTMSCR